jgi:hypothetical protein
MDFRKVFEQDVAGMQRTIQAYLLSDRQLLNTKILLKSGRPEKFDERQETAREAVTQ